MPEGDIAEQLREVLRLHALQMKAIMGANAGTGVAPAGTVAVPAGMAYLARTPQKARFAKLMRAAM